MLILVQGASGSGKSAFAERIIAELSEGRRLYIATMLPHGEEGQARVERHREQRQGREFITLEMPYSLSGAYLLPDDTVLLEDVANLLANIRFGKEPAEPPLEQILTLAKRVTTLVAVTISGLTESSEYDEPTNHYIRELNVLNKTLYLSANVVCELRDGVPELLKGVKRGHH